MILHFVFLSSLLLYCSAQSAPLSVRLSNPAGCDYFGMIASFNATNMNDKIDGTKGPYMLFAICDVPLAPLRSYTADELNYHLAIGELSYDELPDDGLLETDAGKKIRITRYNDIPFVNGVVRLSNEDVVDYYAPEVVDNGVFYRLSEYIYTDAFAPLVPPNTLTILEAIKDPQLYPTATYTALMINQLQFSPPSTTGWTLLVPVDSLFDALPPYQKELLINGASADLLDNHVVNSTHFAAPLAKISKEYQETIPVPPSTTFVTTDTYETVSGKNLTVKYQYQKKNFLLEGKEMNSTDAHYSDGVIHLVTNFVGFEEVQKELPPPTPQQFVEQYDTFSATLKQNLGFDDSVSSKTAVSEWVKLVQQSGVKYPNEEVTLFFYWDGSDDLGVTTLDERLINYHILPGIWLLEDLTRDVLYETYDSDASLRFNDNSEGVTYINGFATFVTPDLKLDKAVIHIIESPFILAPPCQPEDTQCEYAGGWRNSTISEDIKTLSDYSIFIGYLEKSDLPFSDPYTLFLIPNDVWDYGTFGPALKKYLDQNATAVKEYTRKFYFSGTIYPNVAGTVVSEDGSSYQLSPGEGGLDVYVGDLPANAYIRNDGVYYLVQVSGDSLEGIFPFDVPEDEDPVAPTPLPPVPDPKKPDDSSALRLNGMQIWICLIFVLAVLFLM